MDPVLSRWLTSRVADETDDYAEAYVDANFWASNIFRVRGPSALVRARLQEFRTECRPDEWESFFRDDPADLTGYPMKNSLTGKALRHDARNGLKRETRRSGSGRSLGRAAS